jgi:hypothetical protein
MQEALSDDALEQLNAEFGDLVVSGRIEPTEVTKSEQRDNDHVDLPRLALRFDNRSFARLLLLIRRINELGGSRGTDAIPGLVHDLGPDDDLSFT